MGGAGGEGRQVTWEGGYEGRVLVVRWGTVSHMCIDVRMGNMQAKVVPNSLLLCPVNLGEGRVVCTGQMRPCLITANQRRWRL